MGTHHSNLVGALLDMGKKSEIGYSDEVVLSNTDIFKFEVPVHIAVNVHVLKSMDYLKNYRSGDRFFELVIGSHHFEKCSLLTNFQSQPLEIVVEGYKFNDIMVFENR